MNICIVKECELPITAREMCLRHYRKMRQYGDPHADFTKNRGFAGMDKARLLEISKIGGQLSRPRKSNA